MVDVAILIVNYNGRADLERCLRSLAAAPPQVSHEIVVVDNASTDDSVAMVRAEWPAVRVVEAGRNLGFAGANNLGFRETHSALVLLLNSDTIVPARAIDSLVCCLRAAPDAAIAGPRIVDGNQRVELSWGRMLSPWNEMRQKALVRGHERQVAAVSRWIERRAHQRRIVDWVSGACLLVRRDDAEAVGLLDDRYFLYAEDVDFCAAVRARGRSVIFCPDAEIVHLRGRSRAAAPGASERAYRRSQVAFYEKHHPRWARWLRLYLRLRGRLPRP